MARRTFFSFHYKPDVWRAWNVRNSWIVKPEDEISVGFFDSSVFEAAQKESEDSLKNFLRDGMKYTSVTCVLAGTNTFARRWVRYEIVRSVLKGNGLLTVDINGVEDKSQVTSTKGADPLAFIGLYRDHDNIFFAEGGPEGKWIKYKDYSLSVAEDEVWFDVPEQGVTPISSHYQRYDFTAQDGRSNIGGWIETAAGLAGR